MNMKTQLKDVLHLYLGCDYTFRYDLNADKRNLECIDIFHHANDIIPKLRQLSTMMEEEREEFRTLIGLEKEDLDCLVEETHPVLGKVFGTAHLTNVLEWAVGVKYLLNKHFDLFNLIPTGQAIDKTKP